MSPELLLISTLFIATVAEAGYNCQGKLTAQQRQQIVDQHNQLRSKLIHGQQKNSQGQPMPHGKNMMKLTWNCDLEQTAQWWADRCVFKHSSSQERKGAGENLYTYWSSGSVKEAAAKAGLDAGEAWWSELPKLYRNNPSNVLTMQVFNQGVGHFTQMAWGETYEIGCGVASNCDSGHRILVVCHYKTAGNMLGEKIYELGEPCQSDNDCNTKKCSKSDGLCMK